MKVLGYVFSLLIIIVVFDAGLLRALTRFGYPVHYRRENQLRYPAPYRAFTGKPNVRGHNRFGFLGEPLQSFRDDDFKIAFFGGSTGYFGQPPIPVMIEQILQQEVSSNIKVANLSVVSSNHRQHLHSIIEDAFVYHPDIIIFYGGFNETILSGLFDPRPGYPFNYFYRGETGPSAKVLLRYSAIAGELDKHFNLLSGLGTLRKTYRPFSKEWNRKIVDKYFETIGIANALTSAIHSKWCHRARFLAFYQPSQNKNASWAEIKRLIRNRSTDVPHLFDVSDAYDSLGRSVYGDYIHVKQSAKETMARAIVNIIEGNLKGGLLAGCSLKGS